MSHPELDELMSAWRAEPLPAPGPRGLGGEGTLVVAAALRKVAERRRRQRRLWNAGAVVLAAAAVVGLALTGWRELARPTASEVVALASVSMDGSEGEVVVTDSVGHLVDVASLPEGYGVRTEQGSARLGFPSGARARVASRSSLKVTAARRSEALFLARGRVEVEVPKLDAERGFSVETPDARVTVHGTRFSVDVVTTPDGPRTRVGVTHGIVSVQHAGREVRLTAGQEWPAEAVAPEAPADAVEAPEAAEYGADEGAEELVEAGAVRSTPRARRVARGEGKPGELAEQNRRFARAMHLKKNGEARAALAELTQIARRYPRSPLMQELRVERLRLLHGLGLTSEAAREARAYLRAFPEGYAEREAREILAEQP